MLLPEDGRLARAGKKGEGARKEGRPINRAPSAVLGRRKSGRERDGGGQTEREQKVQCIFIAETLRIFNNFAEIVDMRYFFFLLGVASRSLDHVIEDSWRKPPGSVERSPHLSSTFPFSFVPIFPPSPRFRSLISSAHKYSPPATASLPSPFLSVYQPSHRAPFGERGRSVLLLRPSVRRCRHLCVQM